MEVEAEPDGPWGAFRPRQWHTRFLQSLGIACHDLQVGESSAEVDVSLVLSAGPPHPWTAPAHPR